MKSTVLFALSAAVLLPLAAPAAIAQSDPGSWQYTIAPYLMAGSLDGSLGIGPIEADVDGPSEAGAMDYEDGSGREFFAYDVTMSGPQVGVGFHF